MENHICVISAKIVMHMYELIIIQKNHIELSQIRKLGMQDIYATNYLTLCGKMFENEIIKVELAEKKESDFIK